MPFQEDFLDRIVNVHFSGATEVQRASYVTSGAVPDTAELTLAMAFRVPLEMFTIPARDDEDIDLPKRISPDPDVPMVPIIQFGPPAPIYENAAVSDQIAASTSHLLRSSILVGVDGSIIITLVGPRYTTSVSHCNLVGVPDVLLTDTRTTIAATLFPAGPEGVNLVNVLRFDDVPFWAGRDTFITDVDGESVFVGVVEWVTAENVTQLNFNNLPLVTHLQPGDCIFAGNTIPGGRTIPKGANVTFRVMGMIGDPTGTSIEQDVSTQLYLRYKTNGHVPGKWNHIAFGADVSSAVVVPSPPFVFGAPSGPPTVTNAHTLYVAVNAKDKSPTAFTDDNFYWLGQKVSAKRGLIVPHRAGALRSSGPPPDPTDLTTRFRGDLLWAGNYYDSVPISAYACPLDPPPPPQTPVTRIEPWQFAIGAFEFNLPIQSTDDRYGGDDTVAYAAVQVWTENAMDVGKPSILSKLVRPGSSPKGAGIKVVRPSRTRPTLGEPTVLLDGSPTRFIKDTEFVAQGEDLKSVPYPPVR